eukprot:14432633-Ditylum_brightwellii.AAC.1
MDTTEATTGGPILFIKARFVSDISSADRKYLGSMFKSKLPPKIQVYTQNYRWLRQEEHNTKSWQIFTGKLKKILCLPDGRIKTPLKPWQHDSTKWQW